MGKWGPTTPLLALRWSGLNGVLRGLGAACETWGCLEKLLIFINRGSP